MNSFPIFIYDGDCAFCSSSVRLISRFVKNTPPMKPYQWCDLIALGLTETECREKAQFVLGQYRKFSGADAFAELFKAASFPWKLVGILLSLPIIRNISRLVYKIIAANRYRLPGGTPTCGLN